MHSLMLHLQSWAGEWQKDGKYMSSDISFGGFLHFAFQLHRPTNVTNAKLQWYNYTVTLPAIFLSGKVKAFLSFNLNT